MQSKITIPIKQKVPIDKNTTDARLSLNQLLGTSTITGAPSTLITVLSLT